MLTPVVKRLMIANVVVFFLTLLVGRGFMFDWFAFQPTEIFFRPWGVFTYMFLHAGWWHLFFNMLVLFFFGPPLESRWGDNEFLRFYFCCGLGGVALSYIFLPVNLVGASAAMYGLMLAFAMNWPDVPIYIWGIFPVKAKYLVSFIVVVAALSAFGGTNDGVAHFAHLGGLAAGFIYLRADWRLNRYLGWLKKKTSKSHHLVIVRGDKSAGYSAADAPGQRHGEDPVLLDRVDEVLDKISAEGMSSLTPEELRLLDRVSKHHRTN
jgi:membrane associated rhomboid family serine protease